MGLFGDTENGVPEPPYQIRFWGVDGEMYRYGFPHPPLVNSGGESITFFWEPTDDPDTIESVMLYMPNVVALEMPSKRSLTDPQIIAGIEQAKRATRIDPTDLRGGD